MSMPTVVANLNKDMVLDYESALTVVKKELNETAKAQAGEVFAGMSAVERFVRVSTVSRTRLPVVVFRIP